MRSTNKQIKTTQGRVCEDTDPRGSWGRVREDTDPRGSGDGFVRTQTQRKANSIVEMQFDSSS